MIIRHSADAVLHDPDRFFRRGRIVDHPESVSRYDVLLEAASAIGDPREVVDQGPAPIAAVHGADYLDLLRHGFARTKQFEPEREEALPTQFAPWQPSRRPDGILGQLGYHMTDTSTPLRLGTWRAIYGSAQAAINAADDAAAQGAAYALCRPPGHHASSAHAGGFCYLNNAAIAAQRLRDRAGPIAILDIDVHHGNGTQAIFYDRDDILFVSVHADPSNYFPYFSGYAEERGTGPGEGYNLNLPLPLGTGDEAYCRVIGQGLDRIARFDPKMLVVSLGLDASEDDPIGAFAVTTAGFGRAAEMIASFAKPTVLIQEGGYASEALSRNLGSFLGSFQSAHQSAKG